MFSAQTLATAVAVAALLFLMSGKRLRTLAWLAVARRLRHTRHAARETAVAAPYDSDDEAAPTKKNE